MKTVHDSNSEFSMTYTHIGVSVTLFGKVLIQDYLSTAGSEEENEEHLGILFANSLPAVAQQVATQLTIFHSEFEKALASSSLDHLRSQHVPSKNNNEVEKNTAQHPADHKP